MAGGASVWVRLRDRPDGRDVPGVSGAEAGGRDRMELVVGDCTAVDPNRDCGSGCGDCGMADEIDQEGRNMMTKKLIEALGDLAKRLDSIWMEKSKGANGLAKAGREVHHLQRVTK